jgi:hypothetical protein
MRTTGKSAKHQDQGENSAARALRTLNPFLDNRGHPLENVGCGAAQLDLEVPRKYVVDINAVCQSGCEFWVAFVLFIVAGGQS